MNNERDNGRLEKILPIIHRMSDEKINAEINALLKGNHNYCQNHNDIYNVVYGFSQDHWLTYILNFRYVLLLDFPAETVCSFLSSTTMDEVVDVFSESEMETEQRLKSLEIAINVYRNLCVKPRDKAEILLLTLMQIERQADKNEQRET